MSVWKMMGMYKLVCVGKLVTYWNLHPLQISKYRKASTTISVVSVGCWVIYGDRFLQLSVFFITAQSISCI